METINFYYRAGLDYCIYGLANRPQNLDKAMTWGIAEMVRRLEVTFKSQVLDGSDQICTLGLLLYFQVASQTIGTF